MLIDRFLGITYRISSSYAVVIIIIIQIMDDNLNFMKEDSFISIC